MTETLTAVSRRHGVFHALAVQSVEQLTEDAVAITFAVPDDLRDNYAYDAGQHLTVRTEIDGVEVRRNYSICAPATSGRLRVAVKRLEGGVFSGFATGALAVGDVMDVMTPTGRFVPRLDPGQAKRYCAVAAGSGITPVLSIVATVLDVEPDSSVTLVYGNRTTRSVMFLDELADLKDRHPTRFRVINVLSREQQDVELLSGRLDGERLRRILDELLPPGDVDAWFLCGPQQMVIDLRETLLDVGVASSAVHTELFHADPVPRKPVATIEGAPEGAAHVTIKLDGRTSELDLRPDDVGVLEAALRVRSDLPFACRGGVCGTCRALLVEGEVSMDVNYALEPEEIEKGYVLTCQSHPASERVVLDYDA